MDGLAMPGLDLNGNHLGLRKAAEVFWSHLAGNPVPIHDQAHVIPTERDAIAPPHKDATFEAGDEDRNGARRIPERMIHQRQMCDIQLNGPIDRHQSGHPASLLFRSVSGTATMALEVVT